MRHTFFLTALTVALWGCGTSSTTPSTTDVPAASDAASDAATDASSATDATPTADAATTDAAPVGDTGATTDAAPADGGGDMAMNGCTMADYVDQTMGTSNDRMIMTRGTTNAFDYPCMMIRAGQSVMFMWSFTRHPLAPGLAPGETGAAPTTTPITAHNTGSLYTIRFPTAGTYPFYCTAHPSAMKGAVMVVP